MATSGGAAVTGVTRRASALDKSVEPLGRYRPVSDDLVDVARPGRPRRAAFQQVQQFLTGLPWSLSDHQDAAVVLVGRIPGEAQLQRPAAGPPAEADALDLAVHPGVEPGRLAVWSMRNSEVLSCERNRTNRAMGRAAH